jgi:hypothetical protein
MNAALQGALVGLGIGVALLVFDVMAIRRTAAERAKRNHQTEVVLDSTEKGRIKTLLRFCLALPPVLAGGFWIVDKV